MSNEYAWSYAVYDSNGTRQSADSDVCIVKVLGTNERLDSLSGLIKIEAYSSKKYNGSTFDWYRQNSDSLVGIAYSGAGRVPLVVPKSGGANGLHTSERISIAPAALPKIVQIAMKMKGIFADSILYYDYARLVYKYPLATGKSWISIRSPFLQTRQVAGWESIATKAGTFYCAKILTRLPEIDPTFEWYEYVSSRGMIRRIISGSFIITDEKGNNSGPFTATEQAEIVSTIN